MLGKAQVNIMRILKLIVITLILSVLAVPLLSCGSEPDEAELSESQVVTAQRGNLTIDITASGNLALSYTAEPAFEIAGTTQEPLTVEEVLVEEGDSVREGQVLARLDTTSLEQAVKTAERAVRTAEIDLEKATDNYRKITYPYSYRTLNFDVPAAVALTSNAQRELDKAMEVMQELGLSREQYSWQQYWDVFTKLKRAQDDLVKVKENLIRGYGQDVFQTGILPMTDFWTLRAAQLDMDKAQVASDKAQDALDTAKDDLEKAVVVAPFDGFITKVNVEGGDEVKRGTVAVQLADPDKFEAEVMVNEMDIFQVKLRKTASVQVDAMPALTLPAKVTHIAPTATIEAGVVNYKVKVELQSLQAVMQERQEAMPTMLPGDFQLREGLTVTVSILVEQKNDVLLVPNRAITRRGMETYVQVLKDSVIEERAIQTGISNWQYTEVTGGLSEGEKVVAPQGTATTPTTPRPGGPMPFIRPH